MIKFLFVIYLSMASYGLYTGKVIGTICSLGGAALALYGDRVFTRRDRFARMYTPAEISNSDSVYCLLCAETEAARSEI